LEGESKNLTNRISGAFLWSWPRAVLAATVIALVAANVAWLWRFRYGYPLDIDEAGYMSTALNFTAAFESDGLGGLWDAFMIQTPQAPLVPLLTVPFQLLFAYRIFPGFLLQECFFVLLVLSSYGIGRRLTTPAYGALTAVAVATIPMVTDFTRHYIFAIDNAALLTAAVFALLASDRLGRRGWALLFGALLGLAVLARTMTLGFAPRREGGEPGARSFGWGGRRRVVVRTQPVDGPGLPPRVRLRESELGLRRVLPTALLELLDVRDQ
jgi:4-amino-4-deoxy-L-arabinose transferase-like glycosyltransferase